MTPEEVRASAPTEAERRERGRRNIAHGIALAAFVILVFAITIVRLSGNLAQGAAG